MDCYITNGKIYIRLNNKGQPETCARVDAQKFSKEKGENILRNLPKTMKKFHFKLKIIFQTVIPDGNTNVDEKNTENTENILYELDDFYKDYNIDTNRNDNPYQYEKKTNLENKVFQEVETIEDFIRSIVSCLSEIDVYIKNMEYLEKECDLRILDIRHFLRSKDTKLSTVYMSRIGYLLQKYERKREKYKKQKNCMKLFKNNLEQLKNPEYVDILNRIINSEYRYRRFSKSFLESYAKGEVNDSRN